MAKVQWYQSGRTVTASLKLPSQDLEEVEATFDEQYCCVHAGGSLVWECHLGGRIVPERCKLTLGRVRAELKMVKEDPGQWNEFEMEPPSKRQATENNAPVATPTTSLPQPSKKKTPFVLEDLTYLNHVPHDCIDMGGEVVSVKVGVGAVREKSCKVVFRQRSLEICFQTSDQKFLRTCSGSTLSTTFVWSANLFDSIVPGECSYSVRPGCVELQLKKATNTRWKALEKRQRSSGISTPGLTNEVQGDENLANLDEEDDNLNDLDIDSIESRPPAKCDDVTITSSQKASGHSALSDVSNTEREIESKHKSRTDQSDLFRTPQQPPAKTQTDAPQSKLRGGGREKFPQERPPNYDVPSTPRYPSSSKILPSDIESYNPSYRINQLRRPSLTGLNNLGNTCFMNSVLQCLSNTQELRDFFIDGLYLKDINLQNPLGFKGELVKLFALIIRKLWSGEYDNFSPKRLKSLIATRSGHFGGHSQHDSHEFMSYLLDGLHEDLNRITEKPQTKPVDSEGRADVEIAAESWKVHQLRNNSFFVDMFQGLFKSTLVCPECSKVSVTFDPFMSLSVPIPRNLRQLPVIFVSKNPDSTPKQYILKLPPDANLELLKASVARKTGISMTQLRVFEAYKGKFHALLSHNQQPIKSIEENDLIIVSEVLSSRDVGGGEVVEVNVIQRLQFPIFPTKCNSCGKQAEELGRKLQRCGKCKAIGYCDQQCQRVDWPSHKMMCRQGRPSPIGLPFVVSLPAKELTYHNLATLAEKFARHSVEYKRKDQPQEVARSIQEIPEEPTGSIQESAKSIQEIPEEPAGSIQESAKSIQEIPEEPTGSIQESAKSIQEIPEEPTGSIQESAKSIQEISEEPTGSIQELAKSIQEMSEGLQQSADGMQECAGDHPRPRKQKPMYVLTPVDRYGDSVHETTPLKDLGEQLLTIEGQFLAMDWRNNPKDEDSVTVTAKPSMDFEPDTVTDVSSSGPLTLQQCLELFTEPETLSSEEAWYCPQCKSHCEATKQMSVWRLPKVLIIHLKRFSFRNYIWRDKINKMVTFPLRGLDMSPYMLGDAANQISSDHLPIYDLYATVNHYGNIYLGHYTAIVKPPVTAEMSSWLYYDDDKVYKLPPDKVVDKEAYILFYCRREPLRTKL